MAIWIMSVMIMVLIIYSSVITYDYFNMKGQKDHFRKLYGNGVELNEKYYEKYYKEISSKENRIIQLEHQIQDLYEEKNVVREARKIKNIGTTLFINERNIEFYTGNDIRKKLAISMADELANYIEYYIDSDNYTQFGRGVHGRIKIISMED